RPAPPSPRDRAKLRTLQRAWDRDTRRGLRVATRNARRAAVTKRFRRRPLEPGRKLRLRSTRQRAGMTEREGQLRGRLVPVLGPRPGRLLDHFAQARPTVGTHRLGPHLAESVDVRRGRAGVAFRLL